MSYVPEGYYDVYDECPVTARIEHECSACDEKIRTGSIYYRVRIVYEGTAKTIKRCDRCQAIHVHLRELGNGNTWPEERLDCGLDYGEEWGELPKEVEVLAFAFPGETQNGLKSL